MDKKISMHKIKSVNRAIIVIILLLIAAYLIFVPALARSQRRASVLNLKSELLSAYADLKVDNTNMPKDPYHVRLYTNCYSIGGTIYQCVLAADSWDYQGASNLLVLTTNKTFLYIDGHGPILLNGHPPGY